MYVTTCTCTLVHAHVLPHNTYVCTFMYNYSVNHLQNALEGWAMVCHIIIIQIRRQGIKVEVHGLKVGLQKMFQTNFSYAKAHTHGQAMPFPSQ